MEKIVMPYTTKKKTKNVPPVTVEAEPVKPEAPEEIEGPATTEDKEAAQEIVEAKPLTAEERLFQLETKLGNLDRQFEQAINEDRQVLNKLMPLIQLSEQIQAQQQATQQNVSNAQPIPRGATIADLIQIINTFAGQGGGGDSELAQLGKESLKADIELSRTLKSAVVSSIVTRTTKDITGAIPT